MSKKQGYRETIKNICNLSWENLDGKDLQQLMHLSYVSAREFAESLRIALQLYPKNNNLKEMAEEELQTKNLSFEDYNKVGDHADFLGYFLKKYDIENNKDLEVHTEKYLKVCRALGKEVRAMTIFSREEELPGIFERIIEAKDWSAEGLSAFRYYLTRHIELDSGEGGHADLTKEFPVNNSVEPFYKARLDMYRSISRLFEK